MASLVGSMGFMLNKVGQQLRESFEAALEPLGLSSKQYGALATLSVVGPMSQQSLGEALRIDRTTMVSLADGLEELGVAVRQRDPKDRRVQRLQLTDHGRELLAQAQKLEQAHQSDFASVLEPNELAMFQYLLLRLYSRGRMEGAKPEGFGPFPALARIELHVQDLEACAAFYCDVLGYRIRTKKKKAVTLVHAAAPVLILLKRAAAATMASEGPLCLAFTAEALEAIESKAARAGATVHRVAATRTKPEELVLDDPDGNQVSLHT